MGRTVAIICEYNPFHRGHALLLERAREAYPDCRIISVMSGNTVQRGDFSVYDRYGRAAAATALGSDLTVELPYPFSCAPSPQFASAGVWIALSLGADVLMFGSGAEDVDSLFDAANVLKTEDFDRRLGEAARQFPQMSFISLREKLYRELTGKELPTDGNSSLGIEYIIAAERFSRLYGKTLICHPIKRDGDWSATACREIIRGKLSAAEKKTALEGLMPEKARKILGELPVSGGLDSIGEFVLGALRVLSYSSLPLLNGNGIREAILGAAMDARDLDELYKKLPTATYTRARLRREIMDMLLLPDVADVNALKNALPLYTVLLGASKKGLEYLGEIRKACELPIVTKPADAKKLDENVLRAYRVAERAEQIFALTFELNMAPSEFVPRFRFGE